MKKIDLTIKGMHCQSCESLIKDGLMELGVKECKVDHKSGKARVIFDESRLSSDLIKSTIKKQGYVVE